MLDICSSQRPVL